MVKINSGSESKCSMHTTECYMIYVNSVYYLIICLLYSFHLQPTIHIQYVLRLHEVNFLVQSPYILQDLGSLY